MKIILFVLVYLLSFGLSAKSNEVNENEAYDLYKNRNILKLQECSENRNNFCSGYLGIHYYEKETYSEAYPLLLKGAQKEIPYCNFALGQMYVKGEGVLQSDHKAIIYLEKSAKQGMDISAYNLSVIYYDNANPFIYSNKANEEAKYKYNSIQGYAWSKIALALGYKNATMRDGTEVPLLNTIEIKKSALSREGYLDEAEKLASELCSNIPECVQ